MNKEPLKVQQSTENKKKSVKKRFENNMSRRGYYSQPTVFQNQIVFVCENDLWKIAIEGGKAERLTNSLSEIRSPFFSPNGHWIACSTMEEGEHDVYFMPSDGGPLQRLTWLNTVTNILGWSHDGKNIFFRSTHEAIHNKGCDAWLYKVPIKGGPFEKLPFGPAMTLSHQPEGKKSIVLGRNTINNSRWKRYRGGMTGEIWVDAQNTGNFVRLFRELAGNPVCPFWVDKRLWFISDHDSIGNLYSSTVNGENLRQETFQKKYYVRFPATDGQKIVYHVGGELWQIDPNEQTSRIREKKIKIDFHSPKTHLQRRFFYGDKFWEEATIHPKGHEMALTVRGKLFSLPFWEEAVRQHGIRDGIRYRLPCWLSNGNIAVISDSSMLNKQKKKFSSLVERLEIFESIPSETPIVSHKLPHGRIQEINTSPRHEHLAFTTNRMELFLIIVQTGRIYKLDDSKLRELRELAFSPDGRWLAYTKSLSLELTAIYLIDLKPSAKGNSIKPTKPIQITDPVRYDFKPSFDPEGRWLYFISSRTFNPIWDTVQTGTSFSRSMKPYLLTLKKNIQNPFIPKPCAPGQETNENTKKELKESTYNLKNEKTLEKNNSVEIDLDWISNRIVEFPVSEGIYQQVLGLSNKVVFSEFPIQERLEKDDGTLWSYDFDKQEIEKIVDEIGYFQFSTPLESGNLTRTMLYDSGKKIRAIEAGVPFTEETKHDNDFSRKSGWIDLRRIRISIQYQKEWAQMFHEAWRLQKEFFWTEDLSGVDWEKVYKRYVRLLPNIGSRSELSDLICEMQGELGTSHTYEYGGDYPYVSTYPVGFLGADLVYDKKLKSWVFQKIYSGDIWKNNEHSPLVEPGISVEEGDQLIAIGGIQLDQSNTPGELLVNQAGQNVSLTVVKNPLKSKKSKNKYTDSREIFVKTLVSEKEVRYREWIKNNLQIVSSLTSSRIGYLHLPDMSTNGIAEFHRGYLTQVDLEGLIIDVRYNAGGMVSPLILEKLTHRHLGYDVPRWGEPESYPYHTIRGHIVMIANQFTGSDGDMFTESFRQLKLGTIIGKRTWGGVIGIDGRYQLVDGTTTTQPQYSILFHHAGWSVENHGVDPDIEVEDSPQSFINQEDSQLIKAINEILRLLKEKPFPAISFPPAPKRFVPY